MLTVEEALRRILEHVPLMAVESIPIGCAHGRILAVDIVSPRDVPPWDNSAMDGYAVRASDTREGAVTLGVNEVIGAGYVGKKSVELGTASAIMTGAPMPEGADAVAIVERTDGAQSGDVSITGVSLPGDNIRRRGDDIAKGATVIEQGCRLTPARLGLLSSLGLTHVSVRTQPVVGILSTGDELVQPGQTLKAGQIYSSNNITLAGLVLESGGLVRDMGSAPDTLDALVARMEACLTCDIVLTTGGVSVGSFDLVKQAYRQLGVSMEFWKVKMKPGKPLAFGMLSVGGRSVPLFGLPGNPVSCVVNFQQYVRPWMLTSMGSSRPFLPVVPATAAETFRQRAGRAQLVRVCLQSTETGWVCVSAGSQSSGVLTSMALADGLLLMSSETTEIRAGDSVYVQVTSTDFLNGERPDYRWT